jgi:FtsH-binding integral membrane protein
MIESVWKRTEVSGSIISAKLYNLVIGLVLCWGFLVNFLMVKYIPTETIAAINPIAFFVGYLVSCIVGVIIYTKSDNPIISFLGYNFVVVPFGFIVNLAVSRYTPDLVMDAMRITGIVTVIMMILGTLYPGFFFKIARGLFIALIIVVVVELVEVFVFGIHHDILDWAVVLIFCGYIGYDWARANSIPKTVDNAVDSAAALYMDILILFLRILRILGRSR